ncbi:hypothetical protein Cgig2_008818 [Carnegiea gigantea]|uniref:Uncharacterized protein n=1 Tax=Carnegiea gigantea TaxID=171969 RepID=A0A9Q1JM71_9CARY|nr:hypothetical protein Cgig2_008818 [Carnegiea gigantea]
MEYMNNLTVRLIFPLPDSSAQLFKFFKRQIVRVAQVFSQARAARFNFSGFNLYVASICTLGPPPPPRIEALNLDNKLGNNMDDIHVNISDGGSEGEDTEMEMEEEEEEPELDPEPEQQETLEKDVDTGNTLEMEDPLLEKHSKVLRLLELTLK